LIVYARELIKVQVIKATGDGVAADALIEGYGRQLYQPHYVELLHRNRAKCNGKVLATVCLYPSYRLKAEGQYECCQPVDVFALIAAEEALLE
jgi:hypothetical protein